MNLDDAAATYRPISKKALKRMIDDGLISEPLTESDQQTLSILCRIWSSEWYVAQMNKTFRPDKRALMLAFPNFGKIDRYILSCFIPDEFKPKTKVTIKGISKYIRDFYHVEYPDLKIRRVRQIAYNMLRNSRGETRRRFLSLRVLERESEKLQPERLSKNPNNKLF